MQLIKKRMLALPARTEAYELMQAFFSLFNTQVLTSAGLAINGAGNAAVKAANAFSAIVAGSLVSKPAATLMPALPALPLVTTLQYQIWVFAIDGAGNVYTYPGTPAATLATVQAPTISETPTQAVIGSLILYNGTATTFTPGTTALDTALLALVYNNNIGPFFPVQVL